MTQGRLNQCMLLAIYKEMTGRLALIDIVNKFALVVISVLALSVAFAKMTCVLKFALFKPQKAPLAKAKSNFFFCLIFIRRKLQTVRGHP